MTMPKLPHNIALAAAVELPGGAAVPDWIHLVPAVQGEVRTFDGRGPYKVENAQEIIDASFSDPRGLPIDENHSLYLAAPQGQSAPARGWITKMEIRPDGIWGQVDWTAAGRDLVSSKAYRAISPVLMHDKSGRIQRLTCASLVNRPNLQGLSALNSETETTMSFQTTLAAKLGLTKDASEEDILAAVAARDAGQSTAMQSALAEIGTALGVDASASAEAIVAAAKTAKQNKAENVTALQASVEGLQAENVKLAKEVNTLTEGAARNAATSFVDSEIKKGRVGLKPQRDRYISMHMADAEGTEELIKSLPVLGATGTLTTPPPEKDGAVSLNAEQTAVAKMLGQDTKDYGATLQAERANEEGL